MHTRRGVAVSVALVRLATVASLESHEHRLFRFATRFGSVDCADADPQQGIAAQISDPGVATPATTGAAGPSAARAAEGRLNIAAVCVVEISYDRLMRLRQVNRANDAIRLLNCQCAG